MTLPYNLLIVNLIVTSIMRVMRLSLILQIAAYQRPEPASLHTAMSNLQQELELAEKNKWVVIPGFLLNDFRMLSRFDFRSFPNLFS